MSGAVSATSFDGAWRVTGLADDLDARPLEEPGEPFAEQHVVVGEHRPDRHDCPCRRTPTGRTMVRVRMGLLGRVLVGAGVPTLVAAAAFATMLGSIDAVRDAQGRVATSQEAVITAEGLSRAVGDVALAQRGRLLGVHDSAAAELAAADRVRTQAAALADLDLEGPGEQSRVADLTAASDAYLRRSQRGADPAAVLLAAVDHRLDAFLAQERAVAAEQERAASAATTRAVTAAGIGLAASLVALVLVGIYLTRTSRCRSAAPASVAGRFAGGDLDARLRVTGVGEVGDLQRALNAMAAGLRRPGRS